MDRYMNTMTRSQINIQAGELNFTFWESGDLFQAVSGQSMINQLMTSPVDGSMNNLYLRFHDESSIRYVPMLGIHSESQVHQDGDRLVWVGNAEGVTYQVVLHRQLVESGSGM